MAYRSLPASLSLRNGHSFAVVARPLPLAFAAFILAASAQEERNTHLGELPTCQSLSSSSRTRAACESEPVTVVTESEKEFVRSIELPAIDNWCRAEITTGYLQSDTIADVQGKIEVDGCAAATGEYTIAARILTANGEQQTLEFNESWQRDDDSAVSFEEAYPIGENVELLNLHVRDVRCTCKDKEAE